MAISKESIVSALSECRKSKKRSFNQSVDLVVPLSNLDLKKPEHQVDFFLDLPNGLGEKRKVCALIGPEMESEAKAACDNAVLQDEFTVLAKNRKSIKKLARQYDFFIGQANIMPQIAATFGRALGPKGKMPNPKAGCVVPPKAGLKLLIERLQKLVHVSAKTVPIVQCKIGTEAMPDEALASNILAVYNQLVHALPSGEQNVKAAFLKLTMGSPVSLVGSLKTSAKAPSQVVPPQNKK